MDNSGNKIEIIKENKDLDYIKNQNNNQIPTIYASGLDRCLTKDLLSHALYTRTVYELQKRLCCINVNPSTEDIRHGITYDPNINLDTPKDSAHCVMLHTVKQQLDMKGFFEYAIKRFEYITYKIIRYSIWNINNSSDSENKCITLLDSEEFQFMFEIEIPNMLKIMQLYKREIYFFI